MPPQHLWAIVPCVTENNYVKLIVEANVSDDVTNKLEGMRDDFQKVTGKPFSDFYCPSLFRDEDIACVRRISLI